MTPVQITKNDTPTDSLVAFSGDSLIFVEQISLSRGFPIGVYNERTKTVQQLTNPKVGDEASSYVAGFAGSDVAWNIGSQGGTGDLFFYNGDNGEVKKISNEVALYQGKPGSIAWLEFAGEGNTQLYVLDPKTKKPKLIASNVQGVIPASNFSSDAIWEYQFGGSDLVYLANKQIYTYNLETQEQVQLTNPSRLYDLSSSNPTYVNGSNVA
jgi:hypothetical protein